MAHRKFSLCGVLLGEGINDSCTLSTLTEFSCSKTKALRNKRSVFGHRSTGRPVNRPQDAMQESLIVRWFCLVIMCRRLLLVSVRPLQKCHCCFLQRSRMWSRSWCLWPGLHEWLYAFPWSHNESPVPAKHRLIKDSCIIHEIYMNDITIHTSKIM